MATKLGLYNGALREIGDRKLASLTENTEPRRVLDDVYDQVVAECISMGSWNFAMETIKAEADTGIEPSFGYTEVFAKPTDWVRTYALSDDEYFTAPLLKYFDDVNYWSANVSPIYVRYVSSDTGLGLELSRWPAAFTRYVELELAARICKRLTQSDSLTEQVEKRRDKAKKYALNQDEMNEPQPKFAPPGTWSTARGRADRERGNRNRLIG